MPHACTHYDISVQERDTWQGTEDAVSPSAMLRIIPSVISIMYFFCKISGYNTNKLQNANV